MEIYKNLSLEDMEGEVWKDIEGYEGLYQVSNMGRVKSLRKAYTFFRNGKERSHPIKPRVLRQTLNTWGYPSVVLCKDKVRKTQVVHILVAKAFIPNPENKPSVDHENTVTTDNRVENLRWMTQKEQINNNVLTCERVKKRSSELGKKYIDKAIDATRMRVKCITTGEVFNSITEASEYYNATRNRISLCCKGKAKTTGKLPDGTKLQWEYID